MIASGRAVPNTATRKNYILLLLAIALAFKSADQVAWSLLMQSLKSSLVLTDTELGLLTGIAFAVFNAVTGIPLARWADRGNRVTVISLCVALWSAMVTFCALVSGFWQLFGARAFVAIGEAGCVPSSHSLIADLFTRGERPRAVARYLIGTPVAVLVASVVAGWINQLYGWRAAFAVVGLPGLVLALLMWFTITDPRTAVLRIERKDPDASAADNILKVFADLWRKRAFRHLLVTFAVTTFFSQGIWKWNSAFFMRSYGMQTGELGTWLGIIGGLGALVGIYGGGELASRFAARNERLQLEFIAVIYAGMGAACALIYLVSNKYVAFGLVALVTVISNLPSAPLYAAIQTLVADRSRAMAMATIGLAASLVGLGLGPLAVGYLSDVLMATVGDESLRFALAVFCPGYVWGAWHVWRASQTLMSEMHSA